LEDFLFVVEVHAATPELIVIAVLKVLSFGHYIRRRGFWQLPRRK